MTGLDRKPDPRAVIQQRQAAGRDWEAIARCGLCDAHGFVLVVPGAVPTVAICTHQTTLRPAEMDL